MPDLRWLQPDEAATSWRIYRDGEFVTEVNPVPDSGGIYRASVETWGGYWVTGVNAVGEGAPSNLVYIPEPAPLLTLPVLLLALAWRVRWRTRSSSLGRA